MGQGHGEVVRVVPRRGDAEVGYGGQVVAEGALLRPLDPPGEHVGGDGAPGEPAEAAVVPDRPLEGDAEGCVPEAVAGDGQRQQGHGQRREVAQHAGGHLGGNSIKTILA